MDDDALRAASDLLAEQWLAQGRIPCLPAELRPSSRAEAYAVQSLIERYSTLPLFGWKIAATSIAGQAHINVEGPLAGRILAERVIHDGGRHALGNNLMRVAELEFAFRMNDDCLPRTRPYSVDDVMARVATLHPAIEIPDTRYDHFEQVGAAQLIADNACAHHFVLGPPCPDEWRELDLAIHAVRGTNGEVDVDGSGANVLGDPRTALTWLANELIEQGASLRAGQVVTTGTCIVPMPIAPGMRITGDFGALGMVSLSID